MKKLACAAVIICALLLTGSCLLPADQTSEVSAKPELVLRYADNQAQDYPTTLAAYQFAQNVYDATGGRIVIEVYCNAELGDEQSVVNQVSFGGIDFARVSLTSISDNVPSLNILHMPYLYRSNAHMWAVLDGEIGDRFLAEMESIGIVGLSWYDAGARSFYATSPINKMGDLRGRKVRVQENELMKEMVTLMGAKPVALIYSNVLSALQTNAIFAAENNLPSYVSISHYKAAPYYLKTEHLRVPEMQIISLNTWNQLSEQDKLIIRQCAQESAGYERELWRQRELEAEVILKEAGCTILTPSPDQLEEFRSAVTSMYENLSTEQSKLIDDVQAIRE